MHEYLFVSDIFFLALSLCLVSINICLVSRIHLIFKVIFSCIVWSTFSFSPRSIRFLSYSISNRLFWQEFRSYLYLSLKTIDKNLRIKEENMCDLCNRNCFPRRTSLEVVDERCRSRRRRICEWRYSLLRYRNMCLETRSNSFDCMQCIASIENEEQSECQKTNDQLSNELANASLLTRVWASRRKRKKNERRRRRRRRRRKRKTEQILFRPTMMSSSSYTILQMKHSARQEKTKKKERKLSCAWIEFDRFFFSLEIRLSNDDLILKFSFLFNRKLYSKTLFVVLITFILTNKKLIVLNNRFGIIFFYCFSFSLK